MPKPKVYYCISPGNRRTIIRAASKAEAFQKTGIPAEVWAVTKDDDLVLLATDQAQTETRSGNKEFEPR